MKVIELCVNPFEMNCYIYFDEISKEAMLIDPAVFSQKEKQAMLECIKTEHMNIKYIVNTHGHIDHILGNKFAKTNFPVPLYLHNDDVFLLEGSVTQGQMFGINIDESPAADVLMDEETVFILGENKLDVIHTPGHSPGSVCLIDHGNKNIFCGDLIFKDSIGRTDLPGGDFDQLMTSINEVLFPIVNDEYCLYPGHMEQTTVGAEKKSNPFLQKFN